MKSIKKYTHNESIKNRLIPKNTLTARIYSGPKIHQKYISLHLVVSTINPTTYEFDRFLSKSLQPFIGNSSSVIKYFLEFVHFIQTLNLGPSNILISFDVISLFIKRLIKEAIEITFNVFDQNLFNIIEIHLVSTFFNYQGQLYEQTQCTSMGSLLSPVIANIFMEHLENKSLETTPLQPQCWKMFVDDTFVV